MAFASLPPCWIVQMEIYAHEMSATPKLDAFTFALIPPLLIPYSWETTHSFARVVTIVIAE
jgi:hypothetical protein